MAKSRKTKKTSTIKKPHRITLLLQDERAKLATGIILGLLSMYVLLAILSFFFSGAIDQSKLDIPFNEFIKADIIVRNWTGKLGAYTANLIINRGFGLASILPVLFITMCSMRLLGIQTLPIKKSFTWTTVCTLWLSLFLGFFFVDSYEDSAIFLGGTHGYFVSIWLTAAIGKFGTICLLLIIAFVFFLFAVDNSLEFLKQWSTSIRSKFATAYKKTTDLKTVDTPIDSEDTPIDSQDEPIEEPIIAPIAQEEQIEEVEEIATSNEINFEDPTPAPKAKKVSQVEDFTITVDKPEEETITPPQEEDNNEEATEENIGLDVTETTEEDQVKKTVKVEDLEDYDPTLELPHFKFPPLSALVDHKIDVEVSEEELYENKNRIVETLEHYGIKISKIKATIGPTITLYEIVPAAGMRINKIKNLEDDIALSLAALGIRIIAPMPGKGTVGIEVPNKKPEIVSMYSVIASKKFQESKYDLPIALGKTITNETFIMDLAKAPHMLVAGATGQGKSVGINAIITSLLYKKHPAQLKFVFVDPKKVELNIYTKIEKHYLAKLPDEEEPIITDVQKVVATLNSLTIEMDERYDLLKNATCRSIKEYNQKFIKRRLNPEKGHKYLPYIVVIVDEFADLIMTAGKEVELPIARIAQLARAVGIHMILATQRPSTNIVTGTIKANFPARVAFKVSSGIDSRTILDAPGANQLIGRGDMLISLGSEMTRVQCAFVDTPEVEDIVNAIGDQKGYSSAFMLPEYVEDNDDIENSGKILAQRDSLFEEAAQIIVLNQMGSASMLQRKMNIGYNRAGRLIDQMELTNIVGPSQGSKARKVLIPDEMTLNEHLLNLDINANG